MAYNKNTQLYEGFIYLILNDIHPEKIYVGQTTTTPEIRWCGHISQIKKHPSTDKIHNAMQKYGKNHFALEVIETCAFNNLNELITRLNEKERYYIKLFDSYKNGYNATIGGRDNNDSQKRAVTQYDLYGKKIATFESIKELEKDFPNISSIYDSCMGLCKYAYGYIWRYKEDDLLKYPLPNDKEITSSIITEAAKQPIIQYTWSGEKIGIFENATEASEKTQIPRHLIVSCCSGRIVRTHGYVFRFYNQSFNSLKTNKSKFRCINQYDLQDNFIKTYKSAREAARENDMHYQTICGVCQKKKITSGGYKWFYSEDEMQPDKTRIFSLAS